MFLSAADWLSRWGLDRLAEQEAGDCVVSVTIWTGVWWGVVETGTPMLLRLVGGATVMLWPGYQYVWWLGIEGLAPTELEATIGGLSDG